MSEIKKKIRVKMLGAYGNYAAGQEIEVSEKEAVKLLSLGYATKIEPVEQAKE